MKSRWILGLLVLGFGLNAQVPADWEAKLESIVQDAGTFGKANGGMIMKVYVPGEWEWSGAEGYAQTDITATGDMQFRVGSISKMFTAAAILKLQDQNRLSIDDSISNYIRPSLLVVDSITYGDQMTILQLLNHTSGMGNASANQTCQVQALSNLEAETTYEEAIACGNEVGPYGQPGEVFTYSNNNYTVLAMIIEEVTGQPFDTYMNDSIIAPLGLSNTYIPTTNEIQTPHMGCYWQQMFTTYDMTIVHPSLYRGWASIVSTTSDLITFYEKLRNGEIISSQSWDLMQTIVSPSSYYGLGLEQFSYYSTPYKGHAGEVGNTSGLYFCDVSTACAPNGFYVSYNINYAREVDFVNEIDRPLVSAFKSCLVGVEEETSIAFDYQISNGQLQIQLDQNLSSGARLRMYQINGALLHEEMIEMNQASIGLNQFPSGVYLVNLQTTEGQKNIKLNWLKN